MIDIFATIEELVDLAPCRLTFLDLVFGVLSSHVGEGRPIVLFGAGGFGKELLNMLNMNNVFPVCFCDNQPSLVGSTFSKLPVITFEELKRAHRESLIVISTNKFMEAVAEQLLQSGFNPDLVMCKERSVNTKLLFTCFMQDTEILLRSYDVLCHPKTVREALSTRRHEIAEAYEMLADQKSKDLFAAKLAFIISDGNLELFKKFLFSFSEPYLEFGFDNYDGISEDHYYFNNDVLNLLPGETYVDVGAFDGDTVGTFVQACSKQDLQYRHIYALEPDPHCYETLVKKTAGHERISCHQMGVWSHSEVLCFTASGSALHNQAGSINKAGDIEIKVVSLDDFFQAEEVTFIKMDVGGNVIPEAIKGAARTIARFRPKLAIGAYQAPWSIFEIPLLVKSICPEYKVYLRHNTKHLCDTDMYAVIEGVLPKES